MESKFKIGDKIRIIKYGHPIFYNKEEYYKFQEYCHNSPSFFEVLSGLKRTPTTYIRKIPKYIIYESEYHFTLDMSPDIVGQEGIILGSYYDLYGGTNHENKHQYSIESLASKSAWYNEEQLELV